jgi:catechol 2,3-dioxygenase-like lactoylglutathione lyase family enzyme
MGRVEFDLDFSKSADWLENNEDQRDCLRLLRRQRYEPRTCLYQGILGLKPNAPVGPDPYCIEYDVGAGTFAIERNPDWPVSPDGMSVTFEVDDFEGAVRHLRDHGVTFFLGPTETKVCHWAAFRDPDGNRLVIHKRK